MTSPRAALSIPFVFDTVDDQLAAELAHLFGGLAPAGTVEETPRTIRVRPHQVDSDDGSFVVHPPQLITNVANAVTALALRDPAPKLHAAAVMAHDGAVALLGPSDSGKSTMATAAALAGHALLTDEVLACDGDRVRGLRRPVRLDRGREELFPSLFADRPISRWATDTWHISPLDLPAPNPPPTPPLHALVLPRFSAGAPTRTTPLSALDALLQLTENVFPPLDGDGFTILAGMAASVPAARLEYDDLDEGCQAAVAVAAWPAPDVTITPLQPGPDLTLVDTVSWYGLPGGSVFFDAADGTVVGIDDTGTAELSGRPGPAALTSEMMELGLLAPASP